MRAGFGLKLRGTSSLLFKHYGFEVQQSRCSIVVSIPACHAGDPGSIPGNGVFLFVVFQPLAIAMNLSDSGVTSSPLARPSYSQKVDRTIAEA
ncbi:hypothetical protein Sango_1791900 [Sesamum angolense]|uniref:Uncharacterized protein n=1 Tax=Sesamum angolense TaxID=2727404 RepID=A0AAE1WHF9_9LAMI|nr:hypothetical protein Sango_1791900 [Sesamum angolense]